MSKSIASTTLNVFKRATDSPFTKVDPSDQETFRRVARRLRGAARWYILGYSVAHLLSEFVRHGLEKHPFDFDVVYSIMAGSIAVSLVVDRLARPGTVNLEQLLRIGLVYEVLASLGIGLGIHANDPMYGSHVWGVSWIAVWVVMYPFVLRSTPARITAASFASACMDPLALLFWSTLGGQEAPPGSTVFAMMWPTFLCAGLASLGARIIFHLRTQQERARLLGTYLLLEKVGEGGVGEVWRAKHEMLVRPAAIKLIRRDKFEQNRKDVLRRFEREAQATAWLTSPHTVDLFDFGTTVDGDLYYVMEYLDGISLDKAAESFGPFPSERAAHILFQTCLSLAEAHENGMIHRDIKPANIFICRSGVEFDYVKVLDFGLVKPQRRDVTPITAKDAVPGTLAYMAPETLMGQQIDERVDIYGLGCVGYWLITGCHVFSGGSLIDQAMSHVKSEAEAPSNRTELEVHPGLEAIILECLRKAPGERPGSCRKLAGRLEALEFDRPWNQDRASKWWRTHMPHR